MMKKDVFPGYFSSPPPNTHFFQHPSSDVTPNKGCSGKPFFLCPHPILFNLISFPYLPPRGCIIALLKRAVATAIFIGLMILNIITLGVVSFVLIRRDYLQTKISIPADDYFKIHPDQKVK